MSFPIHSIDQAEFEKAENIYKIIKHNVALNYVFFELNEKKYYVSYFSPNIIVEFLLLEKDDYLLVGVDLKVVAVCIKTGSIVFSIGLSSFFKGFKNTDDSTFTIFSELEDIVVNKNGLSINQTIPHDLEF